MQTRPRRALAELPNFAGAGCLLCYFQRLPPRGCARRRVSERNRRRRLLARRLKVAPQGRMRGTFAIFTRWGDTMAGSALISQWSGPLTASPKGEANTTKSRSFPMKLRLFLWAYTRPTYLLYHKQHVLFNPEYAQILHSKIVGSANRRNTKAVV